MNTINQILGDFSVLLIILGALLAVLAIAGKIKTKWIEVNFSPRSKRLPLSIISLVFVALAAVHAMLPIFKGPPTIEKTILEGSGRFQWQWAGQNWIGDMEFKRDKNNEITASLAVNKNFGKEGVVDVMRTLQPGKVKLFSNYLSITDLKVKKNEFESVLVGDRSFEGINTKTTSVKVLTITNLRPVVAFAGEIDYQHLDTGEDGGIVREGTGDIVLVQISRNPN